MNRSDVIAIIKDRARAYGLDPATMVAIAGIETGGTYDPGTANPRSSARGLFQFMTRPGGSWGEYGRGANVFDPMANADAGARITRDNIAYFTSRMGREPTPGETYLMHQQGRAGAVALLSEPQRRAVDVLRQFYRNPNTARQAVALNAGRPDMTARDFSNLWQRQMDRRMGRQPPPPRGLVPDAAAFSPQPLAAVDTGLVPNFPQESSPSQSGAMAAGATPPAGGMLSSVIDRLGEEKAQRAISTLQRVARASQPQDTEPLRPTQMNLGPTQYAQALKSGILSNYLGGRQ